MLLAGQSRFFAGPLAPRTGSQGPDCWTPWVVCVNTSQHNNPNGEEWTRKITHISIPSHLQVPRRRIRIPRPRESRKVARNQLQSLQVIRIPQRVLVAVRETDIRTVQTEVRQVRVAIGVARSNRTAGETRSAKVVGVVASVGTVEVVVVGGFECVRGRASVHGRFVDAAESLVGSDAPADIEGVEGQVAGVVEGEETAGDGELSVFGGDAQAGLNALGKGADVGGWEVGERCSVASGCSEHDWT
jgi:hypothetical protein